MENITISHSTFLLGLEEEKYNIGMSNNLNLRWSEHLQKILDIAKNDAKPHTIKLQFLVENPPPLTSTPQTIGKKRPLNEWTIMDAAA
jgi:hypothetical protein